MSEHPIAFHYRLPTRRSLAAVGGVIALTMLAFWICVLISADQGMGGRFLTRLGILFSAFVLIVIVNGLLRPDAIECIVDDESIRWHIPAVPWRSPRDQKVKLLDIVEVHADLDDGNDVDSVNFILKDGQCVELPPVCFNNHARQLVATLGPKLPKSRFSIVGNLVCPVSIRPCLKTT